MGSHHVVQAGLELLGSKDPPALASQSAGITGVTLRTQATFMISFYGHKVPTLLPRGFLSVSLFIKIKIKMLLRKQHSNNNRENGF